MLPTSPLAAIRWLPLVNQSGSTIPAFACLRIVSTALDATGQLIYTVDQPNGDTSANYLFNGPSTVAAGASGSGTLDFPCQTIWDAGTPATSDVWGPKSGQWTLTKDGSPGFPVLGIVDISTRRMLVGSPSPIPATIVKPIYDIAAISTATPGSGTGEVHSFDGTVLSDATKTVTVYNLSTQIAKAGVFYECVFVGGYAFIINPGSATLFEATIYGTALTSTAATCEVTPTMAIWGALPDSSSYPISANNDFGLQGPIGRKCLVAKADDGTFYIVQIQPPSDVLFEATLDTTLLTTDSSVTVVPTKAIYGGLPTDATITAANDFQTSGSYGQLVLVAEDILGNYFLIPTASQPLPILFWTTLADDLATSDSDADCNAGVTQIFGTMAGVSFSAANTLGLSGKSGAKCLVAGDATVTGGVADPNYYLLAIPPGGGCTFQLQTGDLSGGSATATVGTEIWGTVPNATGDTITVNDFQGLFPRALGSVSATAAAKGQAIFDPVQGFIVVNCDQETLKYKCVLSGTLLSTDGSGSVGSLAAMNAPPFGQTRTGEITPDNPMSLAGQSGANAYLEWDQSAGAWEITGVQCTKQIVVDEIQLDGSNNLSVKTRTIVGMFNDSEESAWTLVSGWATSSITGVVGEQFSGGALQVKTQAFTALGTAAAASSWTNIFTTVSLSPVTSLQYYSSTHNFQDKTTAITAIDPSYAASTAATEGVDWNNWASTVKADPLTAVNWTSGNALTQATTDVYLMEVATANAPTSAGSLATTTATVVSGVQFSGGALQYQTQSLTILSAAAASGWSNLFTTGTVTATIGLQYYSSSHQFQNTTQSFTAINPGSVSGYAGWATAVASARISNVSWSSPNLQQTPTTAYVMEEGSAGTTTTVVGFGACP